MSKARPGACEGQAIGRPEVRLLAGILGVGLLLRLLHVASVAPFELQRVVPGLDRWLTMEIASAVAKGDLLGGPLVAYESSPTYALLLGLMDRFTGASWVGALVTQAVLGALASLFLYGAGRELISARVGILAAALGAVYAPAIFYEGLTVKFALVPVTVSLLLWTAARSRRNPSSAAWTLVAGATGAALVSLRPNAVVLLPVLLAWIAWGRGPTAAVAILCFAAGVLVVGGPLATRQAVVTGRGQAASLWGIHFYIGTRARGAGGYAPMRRIADNPLGHVDDARKLAEAAEGRPLTPAEVSHYWFRRGILEIRRKPGAYLALQGRKLRRLLEPTEEGAFGDPYQAYAARSLVLRVSPLTLGAVAPPALLGAMAVLLRRSPAGWCVAMAAAYAASLLPFFVTGRYRLAIVPPLLICAAVALACLADLWAQRRLTTFTLALASMPGIAVAVCGVSAADVLRLGALLAIGIPAAVWLRPPGEPYGPTSRGG